jgi:hypothetical protein
VLEAQREAIEEALYYRLANQLNLDVEFVFYHTTSLQFEVEEADVGRGEHDEVLGSAATGRKTYLRFTKTGQPRIDAARIADLAKLDGKLVVHLSSTATTIACGRSCPRLQAVAARRDGLARARGDSSWLGRGDSVAKLWCPDRVEMCHVET